MPLAAGQTLAHYEILAPLGSGAMGEVYRARDTRLGREVAIKVLPDELAADAERLRRFEREARTLASLSHANLAHVYGIDQMGDTCFIAMELVPGRDLATRLASGPLPLDEVIETCRQIADGLEAAHEAGVVHRDLKPANVCVTPDGRVKLLDFGLAKPMPAAAGSGATAVAGAATRPPGTTTDSALVTEQGRVLGTPTYMAPEQARAKPIDRRVDVWAFGCVLYECLTGRRPFGGDTLSDVLAGVLEREPDWSALPAGTPPRLRDLLERCLRKDARRRLRDIGDARVALEEARDAPPSDPSVAGASPARRRLLVLLVLATAVGLAAGWALRGGGEDEGAGPDRATRTQADSFAITTSQYLDQNPTWSPDGDWIAFTRMTDGSNDIWLKNLSSGYERMRRGGPGDENSPSWSPDGAYIAYVTTGRPGTPVMIMPPHAEGGSGERRLIDTNVPVFDSIRYSASLGKHLWARDGKSLLVSRVTGEGTMAVFRVGRDDDTVEQLTFPPAGAQDVSASFSFDEQRIVFLRLTLGRGPMMAMPAEGGEPEVLLEEEENDASPIWSPDGRGIVYVRWNGLWWLDLAAGTTGPLVVTPPGSSHNGISITPGGRLAYAVGWHDTSLTELDVGTGTSSWLNRHGRSNYAPRWSPDGREVAYHSDRLGDPEIWVRQEDGSERRITRDLGDDVGPEWSPDGSRLVFASNRDGPFRLYICDRDGNDARLLWDRPLSPTYDAVPVRWSPEGAETELIGCIVVSPEGNALWGVPPDDPGAASRLLDGVVDFDWYLDGRRVLCTLDVGLEEELVAVNLETKERRTLWTGPHAEIDVAPDGRSVIFGSGRGHLGMGLARLELEPPDDPDGLPTARGEPVDIVRPEGVWHVHNGSWSPDGRRVVYVHDEDRATIYGLQLPR